jgi:hypothetical protein
MRTIALIALAALVTIGGALPLAPGRHSKPVEAQKERLERRRDLKNKGGGSPPPAPAHDKHRQPRDKGLRSAPGGKALAALPADLSRN